MPQIRKSRFQLSANLVDAWYAALASAAKPSKKLEKIKHNRDALLEHLWSFDGDDVIQLWQAFNTERAQLPRYLQNPLRQRLAYLLGFHLPNIARTQWLLRAAESRTALNPHGLPITIHDFGAGTGAATLALMSHWGELVKSCHLYDHQPLFLESAEAQLNSAFGIKAKSYAGNLFNQLPKVKLDDGTLHAFCLNYVWNELNSNPGMVKRLIQTLNWLAEAKVPALLIVADAAAQNQSRSVMGLRDDLVMAGWQPLYPCPHATLCPMLERTRDWCFSEGRWDPPDAQLSIDQALGIDRSAFAVSGFVFANDYSKIQLKWPDAVVVGRPKETRTPKPEFRYLLCQADGQLGKSKRSYPVRPPFKMRGQEYIQK